MEGQFVAYYRVSTQQQGRSGLGLDAQKETVRNFLNGGGWELVGEFVEVETGKGSNALKKRPQLCEALALAKRKKATLIIAKLDRLARNVHFVSGLMESGVKFICADMPEATEITLHMMAAFAQYEAKRISERTKEALAQAKARGVKLGNDNIHAINDSRSKKAQGFADELRTLIEAFKSKGMTQREMVETLNRTGIKTARGGSWSLIQVQRLLARIATGAEKKAIAAE